MAQGCRKRFIGVLLLFPFNSKSSLARKLAVGVIKLRHDVPSSNFTDQATQDKVQRHLNEKTKKPKRSKSATTDASVDIDPQPLMAVSKEPSVSGRLSGGALAKQVEVVSPTSNRNGTDFVVPYFIKLHKVVIRGTCTATSVSR